MVVRGCVWRPTLYASSPPGGAQDTVRSFPEARAEGAAICLTGSMAWLLPRAVSPLPRHALAVSAPGPCTSFYRFKDLYAKGGEAALIEMSRRVPNPKNRIAEAIERRILELTVEQPAWGHTRMANELAKEGIRVSPTGVRGVWVRHDLNTMAKRLKALEAKVAQDGLILTEAQLAALEKAKADKEAHGEF